MTATRLDDCRVIEIGGAPSGAYAGKLFAELGAEVVKIEPPQGDPLRRRESADGIENGALFAYLNTSKRSLVLDLDERGRPPRARAVGGGGGRADRERVARVRSIPSLPRSTRRVWCEPGSRRSAARGRIAPGSRCRSPTRRSAATCS